MSIVTEINEIPGDEDDTVDQSKSLALPKTVQGLIDARKTKAKVSMNDQVERVHLKLWEEPGYQALWDATLNSAAVEGSVVADDFMAAQMLRDRAKADGDVYVARQNLATLRFSLGVVMRRFGQSRKERRES